MVRILLNIIVWLSWVVSTQAEDTCCQAAHQAFTKTMTLSPSSPWQEQSILAWLRPNASLPIQDKNHRVVVDSAMNLSNGSSELKSAYLGGEIARQATNVSVYAGVLLRQVSNQLWQFCDESLSASGLTCTYKLSSTSPRGVAMGTNLTASARCAVDQCCPLRNTAEINTNNSSCGAYNYYQASTPGQPAVNVNACGSSESEASRAECVWALLNQCNQNQANVTVNQLASSTSSTQNEQSPDSSISEYASFTFANVLTGNCVNDYTKSCNPASPDDCRGSLGQRRLIKGANTCDLNVLNGQGCTFLPMYLTDGASGWNGMPGLLMASTGVLSQLSQHLSRLTSRAPQGAPPGFFQNYIQSSDGLSQAKAALCLIKVLTQMYNLAESCPVDQMPTCALANPVDAGVSIRGQLASLVPGSIIQECQNPDAWGEAVGTHLDAAFVRATANTQLDVPGQILYLLSSVLDRMNTQLSADFRRSVLYNASSQFCTEGLNVTSPDNPSLNFLLKSQTNDACPGSIQGVTSSLQALTKTGLQSQALFQSKEALVDATVKMDQAPTLFPAWALSLSQVTEPIRIQQGEMLDCKGVEIPPNQVIMIVKNGRIMTYVDVNSGCLTEGTLDSMVKHPESPVRFEVRGLLGAGRRNQATLANQIRQQVSNYQRSWREMAMGKAALKDAMMFQIIRSSDVCQSSTDPACQTSFFRYRKQLVTWGLTSFLHELAASSVANMVLVLNRYYYDLFQQYRLNEIRQITELIRLSAGVQQSAAGQQSLLDEYNNAVRRFYQGRANVVASGDGKVDTDNIKTEKDIDDFIKDLVDKNR